MRARPTLLLVSLVATVLLLLSAIAPAAARPGREGASAVTAGFAVYHDAVEVSLVTPGSDGHQVGDVRITSTPVAAADGTSIGRLEATLTTTSVDTPAVGDEHRIGVLVFTFGDGSHQITVEGSAHYPAQGPTIASGATTVRPIVGGSGMFAGAGGDAVTTHLEDGSWVHEFRFTSSAGGRTWRHERGHGRPGWQGPHGNVAPGRMGGPGARWAEPADLADDGASDAAVRIDALYSQVPSDGTGVVRTDLGITEPGSAPGQELGLWHYVIPAGQELAPHTHPGWQLARVTSGELEYTVESGTGVLLRADGSSEPMGPGTYVLATGDGVVENPDLVHYGANRSDEPVTLLSATLFTAGEAISTVVDTPAG